LTRGVNEKEPIIVISQPTTITIVLNILERLYGMFARENTTLNTSPTIIRELNPSSNHHCNTKRTTIIVVKTYIRECGEPIINVIPTSVIWNMASPYELLLLIKSFFFIMLILLLISSPKKRWIHHTVHPKLRHPVAHQLPPSNLRQLHPPCRRQLDLGMRIMITMMRKMCKSRRICPFPHYRMVLSNQHNNNSSN
jgi:hypothetical protein